MKVTEFAKRAGVGSDVVRYYVREGLLAPNRHPLNGYKLFGTPHLSRFRLIRQMQALGFTLSEIRTLMARIDAGEYPYEDMREQLRSKIVESQIKLRAMHGRQRFMENAYASWDDAVNDASELSRLLERA